MGFEVYDYRKDIRNLLVTAEIRARFQRIGVGELSGGRPGRGHTHDLGHEVFLVLQGRAEFEINGEKRTLGPGHLCVALVDEPHTVRNVGDEPVILYLSVTPHIQPTHTMWTDDGLKAPPQFNPSTTYDLPCDRATPTEELLERHLLTTETLAESVETATEEQYRQAEAIREALARGDRAAAVRARDAMWAALGAMFQDVYALAAAWNDLTYRIADTEFEPAPQAGS